METDASAAASGRPRAWLLALLGIVATVYLVITVWPGKSAETPAPQSNPPRGTSGKASSGPLDPAELKVNLESLKQGRPEASAGDRNPFKFYVKPPPPPPPPPSPSSGRGMNGGPIGPLPPAEPPPPPPPPKIPLKFFGIVEPKPGDKVATFSDCRTTTYGREGDIIAGQYRLVRIGVESVVMEYLDGRGRETIRLSGQECVVK
jgi:hypothetical protein